MRVLPLPALVSPPDRLMARLLLACLLMACLLMAGPLVPPAAADDEAAPPADQDVVVLHSGGRWSGRIIKEDERVVVLEFTSESGGVGRFTFPRAEIKQIRHAQQPAAKENRGPRPLRDEWFLLRRDGHTIGTRRLEVWSVRTRGEPGYRIEERIEYFAQGPQLPATRSHRVEEVDLRFLPRLLAWHEEGDRGQGSDGPTRYARDASGRVVDGVWRGSVFAAGEARRVEVQVPTGARGRLGLREHLLRLPRRVRLIDARIIDPDREAVLPVRAGFASVSEDPAGERPGHEFHWEESGRRLISWFDPGQRALQEEIRPGIVALPVRREQAESAAGRGPASAGETVTEIRVSEAGIAFTPPDPVWRWHVKPGTTGHTSWRMLGRLEHPVLLADVRVEWHPGRTGDDRSAAATQAWLLRRLRGVSPDLEVVEARESVDGCDAAWQIGLRGTLKGDSVRTTAVVVDRDAGRVVLLLAGPAGAWGQIRPALERLVSSIRLL